MDKPKKSKLNDLKERLWVSFVGALGGMIFGPVLIPLSNEFSEILLFLPMYGVAGGSIAYLFMADHGPLKPL